MTISLITIASVMALCWAFGIVTDRLFTHWLKDHSEANTDADHDRWERDPLPTQTCDNCRFRKVQWYAEPCLSCQADDYGSKWEEEENDTCDR